MAMEKEALTHKIEDDLAARNRNWDKVDSLQTAHNDLEAAHAAHLADYATHQADYTAHQADYTAHQADTVTDNVHGLQDRFKDAQIIKSSIGGSDGVVIDMDLEPGFYLLLISRDNAMYYIGVWGNAGNLSEIIPMAGSSHEISITGKRLLVDFKSRTRGYVLLKVS